MGGGGKKPTISQMVKRMEREKRQQEEKRETAYEKSVLGLSVPDMQEVINYIKGMKYITPYLLAEKFGFRLSLAKQLLSDFVSQGLLRIVAGDNRLRIYAPLVADGEEVKKTVQAAVPLQEKKKTTTRKKKDKKAAEEA